VTLDHLHCSPTPLCPQHVVKNIEETLGPPGVGMVVVAVATGGQPDASLQGARLQLALREPPLLVGFVAHDLGCDALDSGSIAACECELLRLYARPRPKLTH
jgi:hypothetical protein